MIGLWIGGEAVYPPQRKILDLIDPMTRTPFEEVIEADQGDIDMAFSAARSGAKRWQQCLPDEKESIFFKVSQLLERDIDLLAPLIMRESGSTLTKSRHEVTFSAQILRAASGEARRLYGDTLPDDRFERFSLVVREPLGIIGLISPFNAPLALFVKMLAFPLIAGNSIVAKPSELTPCAADWVTRLFHEAGLPPGALNLIHGRGDPVGRSLVRHELLQGLTFTGSSNVGSTIGKDLGGRLKTMHLELGGNNPLVIKKDFPLDQAVQLALTGSFFHAGQICMASSRILVEDRIFDDFKHSFLKEVESLYFGALDDPRTFYGPLITEQALALVANAVAGAQNEGAQLISGGSILEGWRYSPTVMTQVSTQSRIWRDEVFGPVVSLVPFSSDSEAIHLANSTPYGLSAGILTRDYRIALQYVAELKSGAVHVGSHPFQSGTMTPVGGIGQSGIGRSGGRYSIEHFTQYKWVSFNRDSSLL